MSHNDKVALSGVVQHVFAHRFTFDADGKIHLADLGPNGVKAFPLSTGLAVQLKGEQRPSEIKVSWITSDGREPALIEHKKPMHKPGNAPPHVAADPSFVLTAVSKAGWEISGKPSPKPKHFEILGRHAGGPWTELHVDFTGNIYKQKPADPAKWPDAA